MISRFGKYRQADLIEVVPSCRTVDGQRQPLTRRDSEAAKPGANTFLIGLLLASANSGQGLSRLREDFLSSFYDLFERWREFS